MYMHAFIPNLRGATKNACLNGELDDQPWDFEALYLQTKVQGSSPKWSGWKKQQIAQIFRGYESYIDITPACTYPTCNRGQLTSYNPLNVVKLLNPTINQPQ